MPQRMCNLFVHSKLTQMSFPSTGGRDRMAADVPGSVHTVFRPLFPERDPGGSSEDSRLADCRAARRQLQRGQWHHCLQLPKVAPYD